MKACYWSFAVSAAFLAAVSAHESMAQQPEGQSQDNQENQGVNRKGRQDGQQSREQQETRQHQGSRKNEGRRQKDATEGGQRGEDRQRGAQGARQRAQRFVNRHDDNDDGALTRNELPLEMRNSFSDMDRNGDSRLTVAELRKHGSAMKSRTRAVPVEVIYIWVTDAHQGRLSQEDLQKAYETLRNIDENDDGRIAQDELRDRQQEMASEWSKTIIKRLDEDDDRQLSQNEAEGTFLARQFNQLDKNSDDSLTRQELQQCIIQGRSQGQQKRDGQQRSGDTAQDEQDDQRF